MKAPTIPNPDNYHSARQSLVELLEYSEALMTFSCRYNKHCDFLQTGMNISVIISIIGIFTPTMALSLAAFTITTCAGIVFFMLSFRRNHYMNKSIYVLKVIDDILEQCAKLKKQECKTNTTK